MENKDSATGCITPISCKMSSSLKERLKKQRRCRSSSLLYSPLSVTKGLQNSGCEQQLMNTSVGSVAEHELDKSSSPNLIDRFENNNSDGFFSVNSTSFSPTATSCLMENGSFKTSENNLTSLEEIQSELDKCRNEMISKEDLVRKLKLVRLYRAKNDLTELQQLINDWKMACQNAVREYLEKLPHPQPTIGELLSHLQIDYRLLNYDPELQEFR